MDLKFAQIGAGISPDITDHLSVNQNGSQVFAILSHHWRKALSEILCSPSQRSFTIALRPDHFT
jgi:hypothetical protein